VGSSVPPVADVKFKAIGLPRESFVPPVTGAALEATWLTVGVPEEFELPLEESLESGVQPTKKRRTAPARTAASL
jgi:hypothetical protein